MTFRSSRGCLVYLILFSATLDARVEGSSGFIGRDCLDLLYHGFNTSGIYQIDPDGTGEFQVFCDQETGGGGWVVFQRHINGTQAFEDKNWDQYKEGFGNLSSEFWLGNEKLHRLSSMRQQLMVELEDHAGEKAHAFYNHFATLSESEKYELEVSTYSGTAGDALSEHNGKMFSTFDQDNDGSSNLDCASTYGGGWWYLQDCVRALLNGVYTTSPYGIVWVDWRGTNYQLKHSTMKLRTRRERPWDYYLSFSETLSQGFASVPVILEFNTFTVSWWMRGLMAERWSAIFSLVNLPKAKYLEFSTMGDRHCRIALDTNVSYHDSSQSFSGNKWHHLVLEWDVLSGNWSFLVNNQPGFNVFSPALATSYPGGHLVLGQSQNGSGAVEKAESLRADIMEFNMWDYKLTDETIHDLYTTCDIQLGSLIGWPEAQIRLHGDIKRVEFVRCKIEATYNWPLTRINHVYLTEILTSRTSAVIAGDTTFFDTRLNVISRGKASFVDLGSFQGECLSKMDFCANGLSIGFWMSYRVYFVSEILGLNDVYQDALRNWLKPFMPINIRWHICYRATDHGFGMEEFRQNCNLNGLAPTLTILQVGRYVFGGFSDKKFEGGAQARYLWSSSAFLFSIVNPAGFGPIKLEVKPEKYEKALKYDPQSGPVFGENDLHIGNYADVSAVSFSDLGHAYKLPTDSFEVGSVDARTFLAGSYRFIPDNIEVFYYQANKWGSILQNQISATGEGTLIDNEKGPSEARPSSPTGWCAFYENVNEWLAIDLGTPQPVHKIELITLNSDTNYVTSYRVEHSNDGNSWDSYNNGQIFYWNSSALVIISSTRHIRLHPVSWINDICLRVHVFKDIGTGAFIDLGIDNSSIIPSTSFTASSWECMSPAEFAKSNPSSKCHAAWCGQGPFTFLQLDLNAAYFVAQIRTKGCSRGHFVASFYLEHSLDGIAWENYTQGAVRQLLSSNWDANTWVTHEMLPPIRAKYLKLIPHECNSICCLRLEVIKFVVDEEGIHAGFIISSDGEPSREGFSLHYQSNMLQNKTSYQLELKTTKRKWKMDINREPVIPRGWRHVFITWDPIWGLKYFENGKLVNKQETFDIINVPNHHDHVLIGKAPSYSLTHKQYTLQISDLEVWYNFLTEAAVKEKLSLAGVNRIGNLEKTDAGYFKWHLETNCTPTNDTGPCHGKINNFIYVESSFPREKGEKARFFSRVTVPTRNCFSFWYHLYGNTTGRLNVFLRGSKDNEEVLLWRLAGSSGNIWNKAEIPIYHNYAYEVITEGVVGGSHGDIAISDAILSVNESCSFMPKEAQLSANVIKSGMIGHIQNHRVTLTDWLIQAGFSTFRLVPCYRAEEHGWSSKAFHERCDNKRPSFTLVRKNSFVFGGFSDLMWNQGCKERHRALGMETGLISDWKISASTQKDHSAAKRARLHLQKHSSSNRGGWTSNHKNGQQWLQINLGGTPNIVTAVATQGKQDEDSWVTSYSLKYKEHSSGTFQNYIEQGHTTFKVFAGNTDRNTVICHELANPPIKAQYVRFKPISWYSAISMRVELYGIRGASSINSSSSLKAFLFSLRSFYGNLSTTRLDIKPLHRHLAVTLDSYHKLSFGINDLTVNLDNRSIVSDVGNVYQAPSVSEPDTFFTGETHFQADGLEVLVLEDSVCEPSCFEGQYCDEITGQCICDSNLRDEEWCLRISPPECQRIRALGMESGAIANQQISASSEWDSYHAATRARLKLPVNIPYSGAWSSLHLDEHQWLQVDFDGRYTTVTGVATQGRNSSARDQWVTKYKLSFSEDGKDFQYYKEQGQIKEFDGNTDRDSVVYHDLKSPVWTRLIRFHAVTWHEHISMRVELYGYQGCTDALGMQNYQISNEQITASSEYGDGNYAAFQGRLHFKGTPQISACWSARKNDVNQWLQVDVGSDYAIVTRVATQGRDSAQQWSQWVTKYTLQFSYDSVNFQDYKRQKQSKEFVGNTDCDTVVTHELLPEIRARYIRFLPTAWNNHISMRVELYGYLQGLSAIDSINKSASFHWTMDNHEDIKNLMSFEWGQAANGSSTIRGIRGKAVYVGNGACGAFTLSENLPKSCVFDASLCNSGFTLMLWLWYKIKDSGEGQVFLTSSGNNRTGHRMYQVNSDTPQVAFEVTGTNKKCVVTFPTPKEVWTHYVLTYKTFDSLNSTKVLINGEEVMKFNSKECYDGNFDQDNFTRISIGEDDSGRGLPVAAFDDIVFWYRSVAKEEISDIYSYYKGDSNLQLHVSVGFTGFPWNESMLDRESHAFTSFTENLSNNLKNIANGSVSEVVVHKYWPEANGFIGCEFTVKCLEAGYTAVEPVINWLETSSYQVNSLEANDIYVIACSLQAVNASKEQSIELTVTWIGPHELPHGVFQGFQIFYRDTKRGIDYNVTARTNVSFYEVQNLTAYTEYRITARTFTLEGEGRMSNPIFIWTAALAPTTAPTFINACNTSSTSLHVSWNKIPAEQVDGKIKGYIVLYFAVEDGNYTIANITLENGIVNQTNLTGLRKYTQYSIQILGFTERDKMGPISSPVFAWTDQDVPSLPPSNVAAYSTGSTSILVLWGPVPKEGRHGIVGYKVSYKKENELNNWRNASCSNISWCEINDLHLGIWYSIRVAGFTVKGYGPSTQVEAKAARSVPGPPINVQAYNTSSTSLNITWDHVLPNERYEDVIAYKIILKSVNDQTGVSMVLQRMKAACDGSNHMYSHETHLNIFTRYEITVASVVRTGIGNFTEKITVLTDEDAPEGNPQNITPAATSARSVTLAWEPLTNNVANGLILGYHIFLFDKLRNVTRNLTVESLDGALIEDLFPYTNYEARIVPFNSKGEGNASEVITVKTKEAAPSRPPSNLTGQAPSSSSLTLAWKPVDDLHINGVLRGYDIVYWITLFPDTTRENVTIPVTSGRTKRAISDSSSPSFELSGLKKYTEYTIQVIAFTVDYGVPSHEINLTTGQDVPSRSPRNITAFNTSSTSINVTWQPIPNDHVNGILLGYRVLYKRKNSLMDAFQNLTVNSTHLDAEITGLEFYTEYELRIVGFTKVGDGNVSEPVFCFTDESVPDSAPLNVTSLPANITALTVKWFPVIEEDRNGVILGYRVTLSNITGEFMRNVSVHGSSTLSFTLGGLDIWTNYSLEVCAFTVKGNGPWSAPLIGITDEEAPRVAPTNVTAYNTSSTSLHVTWQPINTEGLRGILREYRVYFIEQKTYFIQSLRNVTVDSSTLEVDLVGLYKFTNYSVFVVARTNKDGVSSVKVNVSTDEDRPDRPPADMQVFSPHSTSLHVSWNEVPDAYKNGIIRGYKVHYIEVTDGSSVTRNLLPRQLWLRIDGLRKYTLYNVTVLAYTVKGDGVVTSKELKTDQDVPDVPPLNVQADSTWTTYSIPLRWTRIPSYLLNGILTGYRILYQAIEMGQLPYEENPREVIVPEESVSTVLTGLESFAVYRIELTGLTVKGDGPSEVITAETCRCVKRLTANWMLLAPYVTKPNVNQTDNVPGGLVSPFVNDMAVTCCQSCKTHGESYIDFELNGMGEASLKKSEDVFRRNILHSNDFSFPVYGYKLQDKFRHEFGYMGIVESPGIAYVINTNYGANMSTSLVNSVFASWPLALFSIFLAYIAGYVIWIMDHTGNEEHFPRSFLPGLWEGFWWAFVSMTTVGYGDRLPLSTIARLVAIVWTLTGVVILGILVGSIAVSLTYQTVGIDYKLYGAKIAAIHGSAEYNLGLRKNAKFDKDQIHRNFEEIYEFLSSNEIQGVLIDVYMVGSNKHLFEKPFLRIYQIYDYSSVYGVVTGGDSRKLATCFRSYMQENIARIYQHVADNVEAIQVSKEPLEVERSTGLFDANSELFKKTIMISMALLSCGIMLGLCWEVMSRIRKKRKVEPRSQEKQRFLLAEFRELVEDFKTQMCDLVLELNEKYRLQKQRLLTVIKNGRRHRYKQQETKLDSYYQELGTSHSEDKNDLAAGIVVSRPFFKEENLTVDSCADLCITQEQSDC